MSSEKVNAKKLVPAELLKTLKYPVGAPMVLSGNGKTLGQIGQRQNLTQTSHKAHIEHLRALKQKGEQNGSQQIIDNQRAAALKLRNEHQQSARKNMNLQSLSSTSRASSSAPTPARIVRNAHTQLPNTNNARNAITNTQLPGARIVRNANAQLPVRPNRTLAAGSSETSSVRAASVALGAPQPALRSHQALRTPQSVLRTPQPALRTQQTQTVLSNVPKITTKSTIPQKPTLTPEQREEKERIANLVKKMSEKQGRKL